MVFKSESRNKIRMRSNLLMISTLKCTWHELLNYFFRNSFQNDEEWSLLYFNSIIGCWVIHDFHLCKFDDLSCHGFDTKWCKIYKTWNIPENILCIALKLRIVVIFITKFHVMSFVTFMKTQWAPGPLHPKCKVRFLLLQEVFAALYVHMRIKSWKSNRERSLPWFSLP